MLCFAYIYTIVGAAFFHSSRNVFMIFVCLFRSSFILAIRSNESTEYEMQESVILYKKWYYNGKKCVHKKGRNTIFMLTPKLFYRTENPLKVQQIIMNEEKNKTVNKRTQNKTYTQ